MSLCQFTIALEPDGRYRATCEACGRVVLAKTTTITAACRTSADYRETHARVAAAASGGAGGPGTELHAMLSWLGFTPTADCGCRHKIRLMDMWGADECERRMDEILGWLRDAHERARADGRTRLPWVEAAARQLVLLACRRARAKAEG